MSSSLAGENLSIPFHGGDRRQKCLLKLTTDLPVLMDGTCSRKLHVVQVLFRLHCRQRENIILRCLHCTLSTSLSHATLRNAHPQSGTLHGYSADSTVLPYCRQSSRYRFTNSTVFFSIESLQARFSPTDPTYPKSGWSIADRTQHTHISARALRSYPSHNSIPR